MKKVDQFSEKAKTWDNDPLKTNMAERFLSKIAERVITPQSPVVIEIGCGTGLIGLHFKDSANHMIMVDVSESMLNILREKIAQSSQKITVVHGEIGEVSDQIQADLIIAFMSLHHIQMTDYFFK